MAKQIQVSTIAKPRDEYTSKFVLNSEKKQEWIPKKPSVIKKLKFEDDVSLNTDDYCPVYKSYTSNDTFIAGKNGCVVFVLCVGGSGYGTGSKAWGDYYGAGWSDPVGGWRIDDQTDYKTKIYNKVLQRRDYKHNPPANSNVSPTSFGTYLSANAGLNIAQNTITQYQNYRTWTIHGKASAWDWGSGQYRYRSETQDVRLSSGAYDGNLRGTSGGVKFGIFTLKPNEVVSISVGQGFVKGHVDLVYFELRNANGEVLEKPSQPNNVTENIPLPKPKPLSLALNPSEVELEIGSTENIEIITNATSWIYSIDDTIASFDEATKEIKAIAKGQTILAIEATRDKESVKKAVSVKVIEKQQPILPTQPTQVQMKIINPSSMYPNLQTMDNEQLAFMYVTTLAYSKVFAVAQNDSNMTVMSVKLDEKTKKDLQDIYTQSRATDKITLLQYANGGYHALANYIGVYPFMQNKDEAHLQLLEKLIVESQGIENSMQYTHVFSDSVKNMSNEDFVDNLTTTWITELDGIITRSKQSNQATTLDSINVNFSKTPNSYVQRSETKNELKVDSFTQSWDDPIETDYIHELFWYITYSQAGVNFTMEKVKETWLAQKSAGGDSNVSNTPEKRQQFINVGLQTSGDKVGAIGQIFKQAYETDMKDELFEPYDVSPYKMKLKDDIYTLSKSDLLDLFTRACQKVYAITKP